MPAYMKELRQQCAAACSKAATHEVRNTYNAVVGKYCRKHAEQKVRELNRDATARTK